MTERFFQSPEPIILPENTPLVFLEGPVQGAPDWQTPFAHKLLDAVPGIAVASPRATEAHQENFRSKDPAIKAQTSERQVTYEFLARRLAFHYGSIAMWYASQDPSIPYPAGRRYAKTTQIENGEVWGVLAAQPDYPLIVGFDEGFIEDPDNSRGYISRNHALMNIQEHGSLDEVFDATVEAIERVKAVDSRPIPSLASQSIQRALDLLGSEPQHTRS